ncbi:MAG TPA: hypothetical protein VGA35_00835 [bacterium]
MKSLIAVILMLGAGLALAVRPPAAAAAALVLDWQVIGTGTGAPNGCTIATTTICTFSGSSTGDRVGNSTYVVTITATDTLIEHNGSGGDCAIASGSGSVTAADGSKVSFNTVGLLCQEGAPTSTPVHYNGTYRITPATSGRFAAAVGGGSLVATLTNPVQPTTTVPVSFIKIDGTINF